ncbi:MAG: transcription termination/antitermination factor NusG [Clostridia bacterium]|nr:transcription termination/antitermination factor NusG [Clostridia bacterium]
MAIQDAKWYVIHTYSGYEAMVKDSLEKLIENNNLQENIYDIQIPTEETLEEKANGKKKVVERKKFPCYVFLKMIYSNDIWYLVTNTRGVTGFVGPQGRPMPLTDEEVARMGLERPAEVEIDFVVGDDVQILNGPLESFTGKVVSINRAAQKVMVNVSMFGRSTDVEVEFFQVKKVNVANANPQQ